MHLQTPMHTSQRLTSGPAPQRQCPWIASLRTSTARSFENICTRAVGYGRSLEPATQPPSQGAKAGGGLPAWSPANSPSNPASTSTGLPAWTLNAPAQSQVQNNALSWAPARADPFPPLPAQPELGWKRGFEEVYEIKKAIGHGSFGEVRLAVNKKTGEEVAVKTMKKMRGKLSMADTLDKVRKETNMLQLLQGCPGVVKLVDCFEDDEVVRLVTEVCRGGDMKKYVEGCGPLEEESLVVVAFEILKFAKACHDLNIVYADIKPANFCLVAAQPFESLDIDSPPHDHTLTSHLKAIDFGSAHQLKGTERMDKRHGTLVYMAPEVFARRYSVKADIWSIGITLHWLYCQGLPYWPDSPEPPLFRMEDMQQCVDKLQLRLDYDAWTEMSEEGKDFIAQCLTQSEQERPSAAQLLQHPWILKAAQDEQCGGLQCDIPITKASCPLPKKEREGI